MVKKAKKKKAAAKKPLKRKTAKTAMLAIPSFKGKYVWSNMDDELWTGNASPELAESPGHVYVTPNDIRPDSCPERFQAEPARDHLGHKPVFNEQGEWVFEVVWVNEAETLRSTLRSFKAAQGAGLKTLETVRRGIVARIRQAEKAALKWG